MNPRDALRVDTVTKTVRNIIVDEFPDLDTHRLAKVIGGITGAFFGWEDFYHPRPDGVSWVTIVERTAAVVAAMAKEDDKEDR